MAQSLPLVLVPGLLCSARLYAPQIVALWPHGPVAVADHRRDAEVGAIAARILADSPPRFALAGLSMGGYIALTMLKLAPDRVAKLALLDTSARPDLPEQKAIMSRPDSRPLLGTIRCPTLVLVGEGDELTPPELAREIAAGITGARLTVVPDCGHLSTIEKPEAVNAALAEWLVA
jgi:pimeloyl-ACP methyl ester carboxylesterase